MKYSDLRPDRTPRPPRPDPPGPTPADPKEREGAKPEGTEKRRAAAAALGPRPLSPRQRDQRSQRGPRAGANPRGRRKSASSGRPRPERRKKNRRRREINVPRLLVRLLLSVLLLVGAAALLFSPRLWVRRVQVEGLESIGAARVFERAAVSPRSNIVRLPVGRIRARVQQEPVVEQAWIHRRLPGTVVISIRERKPYALVETGGVFYTVDRQRVPFRSAAAAREKLPVVTLEKPPAVALRLGKQMSAPGLVAALKCLDWLAGRSDFPLEKISVDRSGKLCLNRVGGTVVLLGSDRDLREKLDALAWLLQNRADLRNGDAAYVNLFVYSAPAILPRSASSTNVSPPSGDTATP